MSVEIIMLNMNNHKKIPKKSSHINILCLQLTICPMGGSTGGGSASVQQENAPEPNYRRSVRWPERSKYWNLTNTDTLQEAKTKKEAKKWWRHVDRAVGKFRTRQTLNFQDWQERAERRAGPGAPAADRWSPGPGCDTFKTCGTCELHSAPVR